jgi:tetratricopeptide (TPR) repeat protein
LNFNKKTVFLLVDGQPAELDKNSRLLEELGYHNYLQAEDGAEAWAMISHFDVDVVVSALDMKELGGLSLLRVIRSDENTSAIPFILIAPNVTKTLVFRAGRAGVSDLLVWPFEPDVFRKKIEDLLAEERRPENVEADQAYQKGVELMKAGRYDEALRNFENMLSVHEYAEVYFNLGYIKSARGEYEDAVKCFRQATRINNDFARAYQKMAEAYEQLGRTELAEQYYAQAAEIFMERKNDTEAEEAFQAVVNLNPETINVYNSLGIIYRRQGRLDDAVTQYRKALKVHPDDENIMFNLSRAYIDRNEFDLAHETLNRALEANPDFTPARELRRSLEMGLTFRS